MNLNQIIQWTNAQRIGECSPAAIAHLYTDTRLITSGRDSIFIALRGARRDGHEFIVEAYKKGIRFFLVEKQGEVNLDHACWLKVDDTLKALQAIAAGIRAQFDYPVLGITGSNGKTIVKEWLFQLLSPYFNIIRSPKSYNSQIGVPLSVIRMTNAHELGIFEAGISQRGEMTALAEIIAPTMGLITMIGAAHSEGFRNRREKLEEKIQLFKKCKKVFYRKDQKDVHHILQEQLENTQLISWSTTDRNAHLFVQILETSPEGYQIEGAYEDQRLVLEVGLKDETDFENFCHCWLICLHLGMSSQQLRHAVDRLVVLPMRLERIPAINNCILLNDSYSNDLEALEAALNRTVSESELINKTLILSDSIQSEKNKKALLEYLEALLVDKNFRKVITVGAGLRDWNLHHLKRRHYKNTSELLNAIDRKELKFQSEFILLKGARKYRFEKIAQRLARQTHEVALEVNLDIIRNNLTTIAQKVDPKTKIMVMIKAAAYGTGGLELARLLEQQGVEYLGVANVDEGIALRKGGIQLPILILNASADQLDLLERFNLEPEVYSFEMLDQLSRYSTGDHLPIHIKLDTGMHRLGFMNKDLDRLLQRLERYRGLTVKSVFSHLAASEAPEHDLYSLTQAESFQKSYEAIATVLGYRPIRHLLNSSGILRFPQYQMEMVRLGIGLYGYSEGAALEHALTLKGKLVQIKILPGGASVGYGRAHLLPKETRIGIVNMGYADGILRAAGKGNFEFQVQGKGASTLGNICMDLCMIDLSNIPGARPGDDVIAFSPEWSIYKLANSLNTIPYEIMTNLSSRIKRIYLSES